MGITTTRFHPDQRGEVQRFVRFVSSHEGEPALSEYKEMRLDGRVDAREQVVLGPNGEVVGYGQAAWHRGTGATPGHWAVEVAVHPDFRDTAAARELIEAFRLGSDDAGVTLWARSSYVADAARSIGWRRDRELLEMRRSLPIDCLDASFTGFNLSTFRMGVDEAAWVEANNAAFAGHPENGSMTRRDLEDRIAQPWFDANGFFLVWDGDDLAASCWTKIHDDGVGEIYIIGVVPGWEGYGLGRSLICHGLEYLGRTRHIAMAKLFVEADNDRAVGLYAGMGFATTRIVEAYRHPQHGSASEPSV